MLKSQGDVTYQYDCDDERFIFQIFNNILLLFPKWSGEINTLRWIPIANFSQTMRTKLHNVQDKITTKSLMIEFNQIGQSFHFHLQIEVP